MKNAATAGAPEWHRFSARERVMRSSFYVLVLVAIVFSLRTIEIIPEFLYDAPQQTAKKIMATEAQRHGERS